jgi:hypothetical protein
MARSILDDVEEEINKQLQLIKDTAYDKRNPWMTSSLSSAEIFWLDRKLLYLRYVRERNLMPKEMLYKHYKAVKDLLWLRANEDREGKKEFVTLMTGIREEIQKMKGGIQKFFMGGGPSQGGEKR